MAASRFCLLFICATLVVIQVGCYDNQHVALFIFGDSLYDTGNNIYLNNSVSRALNWPYGETFPGYPTGRYSDGRLIPDFIAEYANLSSIPPYLQFINNSNKFIIIENLGLGEGRRVLQETVIDHKTPREYSSNHPFENGLNFATAGAGALYNAYEGQTIALKGQLEYFTDAENQLRLELGDAEANEWLSKAVYMFYIGSNDYFAATISDPTLLQRYTRQEYVGMVIGNFTAVIQEIHKKGGRNFGFSTLKVLGCSPLMRAHQATTGEPGCLEEITLLVQLHNTALYKAVEELEGQLEGFKYSIFDAYKAETARIDNPSIYGFEEVKEACCGRGLYGAYILCGQEGAQVCDNVQEYMFFDATQPTESANKQFAELMWNGGDDIASPVNLKYLIFEE